MLNTTTGQLIRKRVLARILNTSGKRTSEDAQYNRENTLTRVLNMELKMWPRFKNFLGKARRRGNTDTFDGRQ